MDYHNLLNYIRSIERRIAILEAQLRNPYFPQYLPHFSNEYKTKKTFIGKVLNIGKPMEEKLIENF
jgi:hypothetical protein